MGTREVEDGSSAGRWDSDSDSGRRCSRIQEIGGTSRWERQREPARQWWRHAMWQELLSWEIGSSWLLAFLETK